MRSRTRQSRYAVGQFLMERRLSITPWYSRGIERSKTLQVLLFVTSCSAWDRAILIEIELAKEEKREPKIFELFTCHTLRHTYATRCYENGVDQQVVQKLLGHSTLAMTTDLYTHVSEVKKKEEVAELKILA